MGKERFAGVDIRVRVKGGGRVSQIYGMLLAGVYGVYEVHNNNSLAVMTDRLRWFRHVEFIDSTYWVMGTV